MTARLGVAREGGDEARAVGDSQFSGWRLRAPGGLPCRPAVARCLLPDGCRGVAAGVPADMFGLPGWLVLAGSFCPPPPMPVALPASCIPLLQGEPTPSATRVCGLSSAC